MVFGHRKFWLLFQILKLIYFPTITNEETYVAGGGGRMDAAKSCFSRFSQISPRPNACLANMLRPGSVFLAQHWTGIGIASRVCWSVVS